MLRHHAPTSALEAKFSLEFAVAAALRRRRAGLSELDDGFVNDPDVQALIRRVTITTTEEKCPIEPTFAFADRVRIFLEDGRVLDSGEVRFARGNASLPLEEEELREKFMDCAAREPRIDGERLYAQLAGLESIDDVRRLGER